MVMVIWSCVDEDIDEPIDLPLIVEIGGIHLAAILGRYTGLSLSPKWGSPFPVVSH